MTKTGFWLASRNIFFEDKFLNGYSFRICHPVIFICSRQIQASHLPLLSLEAISESRPLCCPIIYLRKSQIWPGIAILVVKSPSWQTKGNSLTLLLLASLASSRLGTVSVLALISRSLA